MDDPAPSVGGGTSLVAAPRAALVFSGFLRGSCRETKATGLSALREQLVWCRSAFESRCDVFVHTWSTLSKAAPFNVHGSNLTAVLGAFATEGGHNANATQASSWPCVGRVRDALSPAALSVEEQLPPTEAELAAARPWGAVGENLLNMRMQMASVLGGLELLGRHASAMSITYHAVVRMRADVGDAWGKKREEVFLSNAGWRTVRRRANALVRGEMSPERRDELVICGDDE